MKPRALVLAPMRGQAWSRLQELADVVYEPFPEPASRALEAEELAIRLVRERARILVTEVDEVRGPVTDLPLLVIGCTRASPDNVDLSAATARGVPVVCAPGRDADAVAELTLALLLTVSRRIAVADREVRTGEIADEGGAGTQRFRAWEIAGRTFGMIGLGAAGRAVAWRMKGLGMRVIAHDPRVPEARHSLETVLAESDVVSLHATGPLAFGSKEFGLMKPGAIFINTAGTELHDMEALVGALKAGRLGGAALDCLPGFAGAPGERLAPGHPLTQMDNVVLTPHLGGATYDTEVNHTRMICGDIVRILGGENPLHCANPEVLRA